MIGFRSNIIMGIWGWYEEGGGTSNEISMELSQNTRVFLVIIIHVTDSGDWLLGRSNNGEPICRPVVNIRRALLRMNHTFFPRVTFIPKVTSAL
ncbi:hypothetical protein ACOSQ4_027459 [Xanthoceras sorbifolium]